MVMEQFFMSETCHENPHRSFRLILMKPDLGFTRNPEPRRTLLLTRSAMAVSASSTYTTIRPTGAGSSRAWLPPWTFSRTRPSNAAKVIALLQSLT